MFHMLIDTCVWLDLAKDHKRETLLTVISQLVEDGELTLILPETIITEFKRNRDRVTTDGLKSYTAAIKRARSAVHQLGDLKKRNLIQRYLDDVEYKIPQLGDKALQSLNVIETIFSGSPVIPTSQPVLIRAGQRGIARSAPFHKGKNSMNDAILIETYIEYRQAHTTAGDRFAFVTHNKTDFSDTDERLPHPDIEKSFSRAKSVYSINLGQVLKRIAPGLVTEIMLQAEYESTPRTATEIYDIVRELALKIWYDRHQVWLNKIDQGKHRILPASEYKGERDTSPQHIYDGARKSARAVEKKYSEELGPWSKFEWGMLNGKLSALRWVLGEDWDSLYT